MELHTAHLAARRDWSEGLATFTLDARLEPFRAGQFVNLGLELEGERVCRSYSLASAPGEPPEFFLVRVPEGALSPALFRLAPGDPLLVSPRVAGYFTMERVPDGQVLWLLGSGTGLGPYVGMLRTPEPWQRFARIVLVHAVRLREHLAYEEELTRLAAAHPGQLHRVPVVSREEPPPGGLAGRVPELLSSGALEVQAQQVLSAESSQVLLCGNPGFIRDTQAVLLGRGLKKHRRRDPGQITTEAYWQLPR